MGYTKSRIGIAAGLCVIVVLLLGPHVGERRAAAMDNMIEKLADQLAPIFEFQIKDGQLALDREARKSGVGGQNIRFAGNGALQMAKLPAIYFLYSTLQYRARETFGVVQTDPFANLQQLRDGSFSQSFRGNDFTMRITATHKSECLELKELRSPKALYFCCDEPDEFRLEFTTADDDLIVLQQHPESFAVLTVRRGKLFCETSESFISFIKQHRELTTGFIFPALKHVGINLVPHLYDASSREAALEMLQYEVGTNVDAEQLIADLTSKKFDVSEPARKTLIANYEQFQSVIQERLQTDSLRIETRNRLQRVVDFQEFTRDARALVATFELLDDPAYLVSLLDDADPREFLKLVRRLEKMTGQKLGTKPAAWKAWVKENKLHFAWEQSEE
jgi:hypothetical protein